MTVEEYLTSKRFYDFGFNSYELENTIKEFTTMKCKELLEIIAEKAEIDHINYSNRGSQYCEVDKNSILNAVNLEEFIK